MMDYNNVALLRGNVSSEPQVRLLPSGYSVVNLEVTTLVDGIAVSVPVVLEATSVECGAGDAVVIAGHVRRRFFRAGGVTQGRTEVVATRVVRASRRRAVEKLLSAVHVALSAPSPD